MKYDLRLVIPAIILWCNGIWLILGKEYGKIETTKYTTISCTAFIVIFSIIYLLFKISHKNRKNTSEILVFKVTSQIIFCSLLLILQSFSLHNQNTVYHHTEIVGKAIDDEKPQTVRINSSPSVSQQFNQTRCSYQVEGVNPKGFYTLQTGTQSNDNDCRLDYGALYDVTGKYENDDFHIKNTATINAKTIRLYENANFIDNIFNNIHSSFLDVVKDLPGNASALVPGMSIGDTRFMDKELNDASKISSLTHLTAISGSHFVIIISVLGLLLGVIIRNKKILASVQIIAVCLLTEMVHPADSVKRAAIMSVIGLFSIFFGRRAISLSALAFVVCFWHIFDPYMTVSIGFALSSAATFSIIMFASPLSKKLKPFFGDLFSKVLSVPIVAQVGCTPILLLMTDYISPLGPIANLLVIPVVEPATILSLVACLIAPILPNVSYFVASFAGFFTEHVANTAKFTSSLPNAKLSWIPGVLGGVIIIAISIFISLIPFLYRVLYCSIFRVAPRQETSYVLRFAKKREELSGKIVSFVKSDNSSISKGYKMNNSNKTRKKRILLFILLVTLISLTLYLCLPEKPFSFEMIKGKDITLPQNWLTAACQVGQGDAGVLNNGDGEVVLIDTGPSKPKESNGKPLTQCLESLSVKTIKLLQISHYHDDHIGGLNDVLQKFKVEKAIIPKVKSPINNYNDVIKLLDKYNIDYSYAQVGENADISKELSQNSSQSNKIHYQILSQLECEVNEKTSKSEEDDCENNSSVNVLYTINGIKYWTAGDLEQKGDESALSAVKKNNIENVDILKVNHHGSKTQNVTLNKILHPLVVIYMVGKNTFKHPNEETLNAFNELGAKTLRTDQDGICGTYLTENNELAVFRN